MSAYKSASFALLAIAAFLGASCSRDPDIELPEALRHSLDADIAPETYQSETLGEDTLSPSSDSLDEPVEAPVAEAPSSDLGDGAGAPLPSSPAPNPVPEIPKPTVPETPKPNDPTTAIKGPIADGKFLLQGVGSKRCLDVPKGTTVNGSQLQIWACAEANPNQIMTLQWLADQKAYKILTSTGKQLQVSKEGATASSALIIGDSTNAAHGLWILEKWGNDVTYRIRLKEKAFIWDVLNAETADGTKIIIYNAFEPAQGQQQWLFLKVK